MFYSYEAAVAFLYDNLPMFQRIGAAALKHDLSNTIKLCSAMGDPQRKFRSIHIAGTNGKGSSSHMIASVLQEAGYKTGLYTSPHLHSFTERIRINGIEISKEYVLGFVNRIRSHIDEVQPSFFEITVVMAFDYFANAEVDVAVIETGLGGRLDSTNVITPILSLITNIGWDHKDILGDSLEKIASEKAGIIKPDVPIVVSERQPWIDQIFIETSKREHAPLTFASDRYASDMQMVEGETTLTISHEGKKLLNRVVLPLQGFYQRKNILGVLQSIEILKQLGFSIDEQQLTLGLQHVVVNTGLKGRWQVLQRNPLVVCDTGHNVDGLKEVVEQISAQSFKQLYIVLGMVKDKDISGLLQLLPSTAHYFFCQAAIPRALEASLLAARAAQAGLHGEIIPDVKTAINTALMHATENDMIFIGGSTFVVAEIGNL